MQYRGRKPVVGAPPHAFTSAPSRAIDNAVSMPIGAVASVGPMPAGRSAAWAASPGSHTAERQKAASAPSWLCQADHPSALRALLLLV